MIKDLNDFVIKQVGADRTDKFFHLFCNTCGSDRGYMLKFHDKRPSCNKCSHLGHKRSEETKKKLSKAKIGNKNAVGSVRSAEFKEKLRQANIGKKLSPEQIEKMAKSKRGKPSPRRGIKTGKPAWNRGQYYNNPLKQQIRNRVSRRLRHSLDRRGLSKNKVHVFDILGYTIDDLVKHLESLFQPGMSWDNRGEWEIDHRVPDSWFDYSSMDDTSFKECWALTNLQPKWMYDNVVKGNRYSD